MDNIKGSELESYGVIANNFYELDPEYVDFFKKELGRKTCNIGPVSLRNRSREDKGQRGKQTSIDGHECMKWLNSKKPNSVVYVCFGSVKNGKSEEWLPTGFEQRIGEKGLLIRGWAPQVLILEHEAIGAFVTHCGWNSTLEAISAGVPMTIWRVFAEQFYNEKLLTQILKTGVPVGANKWSIAPSTEEMVKQEAIQKALREIMVGKEVEERRVRAKKLTEMAQKPVEDGGSSYSEVTALINELRVYTSNSKISNFEFHHFSDFFFPVLLALHLEASITRYRGPIQFTCKQDFYEKQFT
ncbi:Scopoletin glucosyltransferase [Bienertia sinuspersici]